MITIEELQMTDMQDFWALHYEYLVTDGIAVDEEDKAYFQSEEYRGVIAAHMQRERDRHHLAYFAENGIKIGAVSYCTYQSEDGKCFLLDYWIFPPFRGRGMGRRCFAALRTHTARDGATYYELNCDGREDRMRFWRSLGFVENGVDEYGVALLIRK